MRHFLISSFSVFLIFSLGCGNHQEEQSSQDSTPVISAEATSPEPAIKDPEPEDRKPIPLKEVIPDENGLDFKMNLPEGYDFQNPEPGKKMIYAQEGAFQLVIEEAPMDLEGMKAFWMSSPEGYTFKKWVLDGQSGLIVELEKDGKLYYHVDYLYQGNVPYRISSPLGQTFSQWQATQMFHSCRMIEVLNRKS